MTGKRQGPTARRSPSYRGLSDTEERVDFTHKILIKIERRLILFLVYVDEIQNVITSPIKMFATRYKDLS